MADTIILKLKGNNRRMGSKETLNVGRQGLKYHNNMVLMAIYAKYCVAKAQ